MQILGIANSYASAPVTAPTGLSATVTTTTATVSFTAPTNDGGTAITNYEYSFNNSTWTALSPADAASPVTISGLTANTAYTIYLRAVNIVGSGPASAGLAKTTEPNPIDIQYLVIGGGNAGGGGGLGIFGGGAGGGYRTNVPGSTNGYGAALEPALALAAGTYTVVVGAGGASIGGAGGTSTFATITTVASGGTTGTGAGGAGNGGPGLPNSITGTSVGRAGGGGSGGDYTQGTGQDGGGNGSIYFNDYYGFAYTRGPGAANTGGGGGGGANSNGFAGGSGIVIVRYLTAAAASSGYVITGGTTSTTGSYTVHSFTSTGTTSLVIA